MGYTHADAPFPRGEICVRGPSVFREYYKDEENTREAIDTEGWLHTGDIGTWIDQGRLKIIDRKKVRVVLCSLYEHPSTLLPPPLSSATTTTTPENRRRTRSEDATLRLGEPARRAVLGDRFRGRSC